MRIENFITKMGKEWAKLFGPFIISSKMDSIYAVLKETKEKILPPSTETYRAFQMVPPAKVRLVIINVEPYLQVGEADGLAFSCKEMEEVHTHLEKLFKPIAKEYMLDYDKYYKEQDLSYLAEQGVLLLNRALTSVENKPKAHLKLWSEFIIYACNIIKAECPNVPIIFFGKDVWPLSDIFDPKVNPIYEIVHPMSPDFADEIKGVLPKINNYLRTHHNQAIHFSPMVYDAGLEEIKELEGNKETIPDYDHRISLVKMTDDFFLPF